MHSAVRCVLLVPLAASFVATLPADASDARRELNAAARTILSDRCFACHGNDASHRKAKLRLDVPASREHRTSSDLLAIDAGAPEKSDVIRRIVATDPDDRMPPPSAKLRLTTAEVETLQRWIRQGAEYDTHWSFLPPAMQVPPDIGDRRPVNAIDSFAFRALAADGITGQPVATRGRLLRRVTFDLTGLPPTPEAVRQFENDPRPDAYDRVLDRLLASPRYGERMTSDWLDVARYADSFGYQVDRERDVWLWRDWVLRAFNDNLPYDEFVTWQLAGDLLPNPTDDQILATAFNRLHSQKTEGGSVPEEFRVEYVADRTHTFGTAFLGLTLECSRCHDHKFDPITTKEYYQLFAFFNNIDEAGLYAYFGQAVPTPTLLVLDDQKKRELAAVEAEIKAKEDALAKTAEGQREAFLEWLKNASLPAAAAGRTAGIPDVVAYHPFDQTEGRKLENRADAKKPATLNGGNRLVDGKIGKAVEFTGDDAVQLGLGNFQRHHPFSLAFWVWVPRHEERAVILHRSRAWTDSGSRGYQLLVEDGTLSASLIHFWPGNALRVRTDATLPLQAWVHVALTYDGSSRASGLQLFVDGTPARAAIVRDKLTKNITGTGGDNIALGERFRDRGFKDGRVDELVVVDRRLSTLEVAQLYDGRALSEAIRESAGVTSAESAPRLFEYYLSAIDPLAREQRQALRQSRERRSVVDGVREIMVMRELSPRRPTHVLARGHYASPTEPVEPDTPAALPAFPNDAPRSRLGLARWLTQPDHPLTARVAVNRLWQLCFGRGLVGTPEDFGSQGERPRYEALLDWLAREFVERRWDTKDLLRTIVSSHTYRQDSVAPPELLRDDPENRLLARGPSYRLSAEMIRDNALATSGLLVDEVGGAPARPYEVAVSFKPVSKGSGRSLYRRSVYTFWRRTGPAPSMMALDAAKREVCVVRRESTASPLQALVLLNDPQFVEAARAMAERLFREQPTDSEARHRRAFLYLTSRAPLTEEERILADLYAEQLKYFSGDASRAAEFLKTGDSPLGKNIPANEVAATAVLVSALMSFDACVMKR